jgi:hypothetical protein
VFVVTIEGELIIGLDSMKYVTERFFILLRLLVVVGSVLFFLGCNENSTEQPETIEPPIIIEPNEVHCPPQ